MKQFHKLIMFNVFGSSLGWAALGLGIAAVVSPNWISDGVNRRSGLWQLCQPSGCVNLQEESWLLAVRAFMLLFVIFTFLGMISSIAANCQHNKIYVERSAGVLSIAGIFALVGAAIYTGITQQSQLAYRYDWAFSYAWAVMGMDFLAGLLMQQVAKNMDCEETP